MGWNHQLVYFWWQNWLRLPGLMYVGVTGLASKCEVLSLVACCCLFLGWNLGEGYFSPPRNRRHYQLSCLRRMDGSGGSVPGALKQSGFAIIYIIYLYLHISLRNTCTCNDFWRKPWLYIILEGFLSCVFEQCKAWKTRKLPHFEWFRTSASNHKMSEQTWSHLELRRELITVEDPSVDGRNTAAVEVRSLSDGLQGFYASQVVVWDFFHQQLDYICLYILWKLKVFVDASDERVLLFGFVGVIWGRFGRSNKSQNWRPMTRDESTSCFRKGLAWFRGQWSLIGRSVGFRILSNWDATSRATNLTSQGWL